MSVAPDALAPSRRRRPVPSDVDIVDPGPQRGRAAGASITTLRSYLDTSFPFSATITIADNASTDDTWRIASDLAATLTGCGCHPSGQKGRGRALRAAWSRSTASVVAYMDVDLATDWTPCCLWWRRSCPATATWPSDPGSPPGPTWSGAPSGSSSPAATT